MVKPLKFAKCHSDRLNYYHGKCEECFNWHRDPSAPCPHNNRKKDIHGRCTSCMSRYYHWRRLRGEGDNFDTPRLSQHLRHVTNPELRKCLVKRKRKLRYYNLTLEDYDRMFNQQNGVCGICSYKPKEYEDLCIDHDHKCCPLTKGYHKSCGKCVRGLLCHGCNMRLGQMESEFFTKSLEYLSRKGIYAI